VIDAVPALPGREMTQQRRAAALPELSPL